MLSPEYLFCADTALPSLGTAQNGTESHTPFGQMPSMSCGVFHEGFHCSEDRVSATVIL